ncbi:hypothetical protein [Paractinoplanes atraurantiacus]|uniref:Uncharacterized protein n=1 Tax=Paractinoplanes atraurantiacus TaxID=1036182 RepID=A0A285HZ66_9ACTN|nr:hypothetical protein [Actinoplanes atraurantiacus]SNY41012.1 hypothetical protein SAMN05421748_106111 [Actinoplanes atraurantiacus]
MLVEVLLDAPVHVHYGFLTLGANEAGPEDAARGQVNGLCGAAVPGVLHLHTELHTGEVHVRVELYAAEPALGDEWRDVVEVLYTTTAEDLALGGFDSSVGPVDLPPGVYRARYCAADMRGEDRYLLQFWPATGVDRIVRQGSDYAAYWHREGPEPTLTRDELAGRVADLRRRRAEREAGEAEEELDEIWEGDVPDDPRLREAGWYAASLWRLDPAIVEALAEAGDRGRRAVTAWAVERVLDDAQLMGQPWAGPALAALRDGSPLAEWEIRETLPPMPIEEHNLDAAQNLAAEVLFNVAPGGLGDACEAVMEAIYRSSGPEVVLDGVRRMLG